MNSLAMQRLNATHPDSYILIPRMLWAFVGFLLIVFILLPESPWVYARQDEQEKCMKSLRQLYHEVPGYDSEEEYGIILRTLEHERLFLEANKATSWRDISVGSNRVGLTPPVSLRFGLSDGAVACGQIRFLLMLLLSCGGQFAGITLVGTYSTCKCALSSLTFATTNLDLTTR